MFNLFSAKMIFSISFYKSIFNKILIATVEQNINIPLNKIKNLKKTLIFMRIIIKKDVFAL